MTDDNKDQSKTPASAKSTGGARSRRKAFRSKCRDKTGGVKAREKSCGSGGSSQGRQQDRGQDP